MSKCPKCGCEFYKSKFATIVVDKDMPPDVWKVTSLSTPNNGYIEVSDEDWTNILKRMREAINAETERYIIRL